MYFFISKVATPFLIGIPAVCLILSVPLRSYIPRNLGSLRPSLFFSLSPSCQEQVEWVKITVTAADTDDSYFFRGYPGAHPSCALATRSIFYCVSERYAKIYSAFFSRALLPESSGFKNCQYLCAFHFVLPFKRSHSSIRSSPLNAWKKILRQYYFKEPRAI